MGRVLLSLIFAVVCWLGLPGHPAWSADFTVEGGSKEPSATPKASGAPAHFLGGGAGTAQAPVLFEVGDMPTAYLLAKYEMRADIRFYEQGGILVKGSLGLFPVLAIGGAVNVHHIIGSDQVTLTRDDAMATARLRLLDETENTPALALGWDGPGYSFGRTRGLYVAVSREIKTALGFWQVHGDVSCAEFSSSFTARNDLQGALGVTASLYDCVLFGEFDDGFREDGGFFNAGFRYFFDPISLGMEFRDLGARHGPVNRTLRVGYTGLF